MFAKNNVPKPKTKPKVNNDVEIIKKIDINPDISNEFDLLD